MLTILDKLSEGRRNVLCGAPEGVDATLLASLARETTGRDILVVLRDGERAQRLEDALGFFAPETSVVSFPAWDCLPYDRVSPHPATAGQRLAVLGDLCERQKDGRNDSVVMLTTAGGLLQRVPPPAALAGLRRKLVPGDICETEVLARDLNAMGYNRVSSVMESGDFAQRGDIFDIYPSGAAEPVRMDFFGDEIEQIRAFDPLTQRSSGKPAEVTLDPASEALLDEDSIARFRNGWRELFGISTGSDPVYEAVAAGVRHAGMEHWLALFHTHLEPVTSYLNDPLVILDHRILEARDSRLEVVRDHYEHRRDEARVKRDDEAAPYRPVPHERLYLNELAWENVLADKTVTELTPFSEPPSGDVNVIEIGGRLGHDFSLERQQGNVSLFDTVAERLRELGQGGRQVMVTGLTVGSRNRLMRLLNEHGVETVEPVATSEGLDGLTDGAVAAAVMSLEHGFTTATMAVVTEQDILGDRIARSSRKKTRRDTERFLEEASQLAEGDIVVHVEHGIGRFDGLQTLSLGDAPHDCLRLVYNGGDKLFVPVENIDVLSRYGSHDSVVQLDKMGSACWQSRRARLKERITEMAGDLLKIAAERKTKPGPPMQATQGLYQEFAARFPFQETDDQEKAIDEVLNDLSSGRAMDRLVCGDVGFGKTEVALRAAFVAVMAGYQVAVVVPTTLLARQHYTTFAERFKGLPVKVAQLSRFVTAKEARESKARLEEGKVDIVVGTHALLAKDVSIKNLGLLIIDEEQHFGVVHKERLKQLKANIHVLTLTATPIPRTLQMSLVGVKDLSLIATPPVDRLAVRTFVAPYDSVTVREAIRREQLRGGQTYFVCPRIADLHRVHQQLEELVPEARFAVGHGQMSSAELERVMAAFYEGDVDVLISTTIVESGLDIPNVNTMIVYRSQMFGLAQLYQLRGRIGRSKARAYAYLTLPQGKRVTQTALRRLEVLSKLDTLGAGFSLASHDLDIRGAGNLLGTEQSGHIREVGIELYQQMLEEAVAALRAEQDGVAAQTDQSWTPEINVGSAVLIPDDYVRDLDVRLSLYRRIAVLEDREQIDDLRVELEDRFGEPPVEVDNLLEIVAIKALCRQAGIAKLDAGPRGAVIGFRDDGFANPGGLVDWISSQAGTVRLRPDQRIVATRNWDKVDVRLAGARDVAQTIARIAMAEIAA